MGCKKFMSKIIGAIAEFHGANSNESMKKILMEQVKPRAAHGGFIELFMMVACECGEPCLIRATPPQDLQRKLDEAVANGECGAGDVKVIETKSVHYDETQDKKEQLSCTNVGMTTKVCDECGRLYIACWEFEACQVEKGTTFPWEDPEDGIPPASGMVFGSLKKTSGTVH
jgi:hypothetical protein